MSPSAHGQQGKAAVSEKYLLRLYITGMTPNSRRAVENVKHICEQYLGEGYELQVIDVFQQPALAEGEQVFAVPTLIKQAPYPFRKLVGDMSDTQKVLQALDIVNES